MVTKKEVRKKILNLRNEMSKEEVSLKSNCICQKLIQNSLIKSAKTIFVYAPLGNEVDIKDFIIDCFQKSKSVYFPKINKDDMDFYKVTSFDELKEGAFHVMEPQDADIPYKYSINEEPICILVPGVVFSEKGARIGYGKGFYDKYIHKLNSLSIDFFTYGIAYDFQIRDNFEPDLFDQGMNYIVTDKKEVRCNV